MLQGLPAAVVFVAGLIAVGSGSGDEVSTDLCRLPDGNFPNPGDCSSYVRCQSGWPDVEQCPDGLIYNPFTFTCDYSKKGACSSTDDFNSTSASIPTSDIACSPDGPNVYAIQSRCLEYYLCEDGVAYRVKCPSGLAMNSEKLTCDYEENVECDASSIEDEDTVGVKAIYKSDIEGSGEDENAKTTSETTPGIKSSSVIPLETSSLTKGNTIFENLSTETPLDMNTTLADIILTTTESSKTEINTINQTYSSGDPSTQTPEQTPEDATDFSSTASSRVTSQEIPSESVTVNEQATSSDTTNPYPDLTNSEDDSTQTSSVRQSDNTSEISNSTSDETSSSLGSSSNPISTVSPNVSSESLNLDMTTISTSENVTSQENVTESEIKTSSDVSATGLIPDSSLEYITTGSTLQENATSSNKQNITESFSSTSSTADGIKSSTISIDESTSSIATLANSSSVASISAASTETSTVEDTTPVINSSTLTISSQTDDKISPEKTRTTSQILMSSDPSTDNETSEVATENSSVITAETKRESSIEDLRTSNSTTASISFNTDSIQIVSTKDGENQTDLIRISTSGDLEKDTNATSTNSTEASTIETKDLTSKILVTESVVNSTLEPLTETTYSNDKIITEKSTSSSQSDSIFITSEETSLDLSTKPSTSVTSESVSSEVTSVDKSTSGKEIKVSTDVEFASTKESPITLSEPTEPISEINTTKEQTLTPTEVTKSKSIIYTETIKSTTEELSTLEPSNISSFTSNKDSFLTTKSTEMTAGEALEISVFASTESTDSSSFNTKEATTETYLPEDSKSSTLDHKTTFPENLDGTTESKTIGFSGITDLTSKITNVDITVGTTETTEFNKPTNTEFPDITSNLTTDGPYGSETTTDDTEILNTTSFSPSIDISITTYTNSDGIEISTTKESTVTKSKTLPTDNIYSSTIASTNFDPSEGTTVDQIVTRDRTSSSETSVENGESTTTLSSKSYSSSTNLEEISGSTRLPVISTSQTSATSDLSDDTQTSSNTPTSINSTLFFSIPESSTKSTILISTVTEKETSISSEEFSTDLVTSSTLKVTDYEITTRVASVTTEDSYSSEKTKDIETDSSSTVSSNFKTISSLNITEDEKVTNSDYPNSSDLTPGSSDDVPEISISTNLETKLSNRTPSYITSVTFQDSSNAFESTLDPLVSSDPSKDMISSSSDQTSQATDISQVTNTVTDAYGTTDIGMVTNTESKATSADTDSIETLETTTKKELTHYSSEADLISSTDTDDFKSTITSTVVEITTNETHTTPYPEASTFSSTSSSTASDISETVPNTDLPLNFSTSIEATTFDMSESTDSSKSIEYNHTTSFNTTDFDLTVASTVTESTTLEALRTSDKDEDTSSSIDITTVSSTITDTAESKTSKSSLLTNSYDSTSQKPETVTEELNLTSAIYSSLATEEILTHDDTSKGISTPETSSQKLEFDTSDSLETTTKYITPTSHLLPETEDQGISRTSSTLDDNSELDISISYTTGTLYSTTEKKSISSSTDGEQAKSISVDASTTWRSTSLSTESTTTDEFDQKTSSTPTDIVTEVYQTSSELDITEPQDISTASTPLETTTLYNSVCTTRGFFPNPDNCSTFYDCLKGIPKLSYCPENLHFSPERKMCLDQCKAKCDPKADCPTTEGENMSSTTSQVTTSSSTENTSTFTPVTEATKPDENTETVITEIQTKSTRSPEDMRFSDSTSETSTSTTEQSNPSSILTTVSVLETESTSLTSELFTKYTSSSTTQGTTSDSSSAYTEEYSTASTENPFATKTQSSITYDKSTVPTENTDPSVISTDGTTEITVSSYSTSKSSATEITTPFAISTSGTSGSSTSVITNPLMSTDGTSESNTAEITVSSYGTSKSSDTEITSSSVLSTGSTSKTSTIEIPTSTGGASESSTIEIPTSTGGASESSTTEIPTSTGGTSESSTNEIPTSTGGTSESHTSEIPLSTGGTSESSTTEIPASTGGSSESSTTEILTSAGGTSESSTTKIASSTGDTSESSTTEMVTTSISTDGTSQSITSEITSTTAPSSTKITEGISSTGTTEISEEPFSITEENGSGDDESTITEDIFSSSIDDVSSASVDDGDIITSSPFTSVTMIPNTTYSSEIPTHSSPVPYKICHRSDFLPGTTCGEYIDCTENIPKQRACPMGLHFNPTSRVCDWPHSADCDVTKPLFHPDSSFQCPCKSCLIPSTESCSRYFLCLGYTAYSLECSNNLQFDKKLNTCNYAAVVACIASTSTISTRRPTTSTISTTRSTTTRRPSTTSTTTSRPEVFVCPNRAGMFKYPGDCGKYYHCSNWYPHEMNCPATTHFNERTNNCDYPCNAKCDPNISCGVSSTAAPSDTRCRNCLYCKLPSPETCTKYIECRNGRARVENCPWGQTFDENRHICDWAHRVKCRHSEMCPERNGEFPHKEDCHKFIHCSNGIPYEKKCPSVLEFDPVKKRCEWPRGRCHYSPVQKELDIFRQEEHKTGWRCPKSFGYFPDDHHCNQFYHCSLGTPALKECPPGLLYNHRYQTCDWKKHVRCDSNHRQLPKRCRVYDKYVICPTDRTPQPHSHCNMYYDCTAGRVCAKQCPVGLFFNRTSGICDMPENVRCYNQHKEYSLGEFNKSCLTNDHGHMPDPADEACYFHCRQGKIVPGCCSKGRVYNQYRDRCERRPQSFRI